MTEPKFGELTLEQKFRLESAKLKSLTLPTDTLKDVIVQEYIKFIQMDIFYRQIIKGKWGINNGLTK